MERPLHRSGLVHPEVLYSSGILLLSGSFACCEIPKAADVHPRGKFIAMSGASDLVTALCDGGTPALSFPWMRVDGQATSLPVRSAAFLQAQET
jgi:hypothetical protein